MKFEIKHRWSDKVLFSAETETFKATVELAVKSEANLTRADLTEAYLAGANLRVIKHDLWGVLLHALPEVQGLRDALVAGKVNGNVYKGECACLCGTIANLRHVTYEELPGIKPDSSSPAERWFMGISEGDTPETNQVSKLTVEWIDEFMSLIKK